MTSERQPLLRTSTEETRSRAARIPSHEVTTRAQEHPDYPVDHGTVAWMQVLGGFILFANSWYVNSILSTLVMYVRGGRADFDLNKGAYPTPSASSKHTTSPP
jgi:hypothetical protein